MTDRRQVTVRVDASTYEEWKAVAESEYDGMSDLIRTAVRHELADDHDELSVGEILEALRHPYE
ncbi:MAG: hypothetical protein ABEI98_03290 [Halorhabdus sp.]